MPDITNLQPPRGSRVELIEATRDRLLIYIPAGGGRTRGIGIFAILWNAIVGAVSAGFLFGAIQDPDEAPLLFLIPFLSLFWAVGLGVAYWWVRMRFTRIHLLIQPDRLTIQRHLFGRKWMTETFLDEHAQAEFVESYRENDTPVYCVGVHGTNRTAKFGTSLARGEKRWLVEAISRFLRKDDLSVAVAAELPPHCSSCGGAIHPGNVERVGISVLCPFCGVAVMTDRSEPAGNATPLPGSRRPAVVIKDVDPVTASFAGLEVLRSDEDDLEFQLPIAPADRLRKNLGYALLAGGAVWLLALGFVLLQAWGNAVFAIFAGVFMSMPLILLALLVQVLRRGTIRVDLDREQLRVRWGFGPLGVTKTVPTDAITDVRLSDDDEALSTHGHRTRMLVCAVRADGASYPLTTWHGKDIAKTVAGMVRFHLRRLGHTLRTSQTETAAMA